MFGIAGNPIGTSELPNPIGIEGTKFLIIPPPNDDDDGGWNIEFIMLLI